MKFTGKISGTQITDFEIEPIFEEQFVTLGMCMETIHRQESMDYLLDTFRFSKCTNGDWLAVLSYDDIYKVTILENYPQYEEELINYFGEKWLNHYLRFNH